MVFWGKLTHFTWTSNQECFDDKPVWGEGVIMGRLLSQKLEGFQLVKGEKPCFVSGLNLSLLLKVT